MCKHMQFGPYVQINKLKNGVLMIQSFSHVFGKCCGSNAIAFLMQSTKYMLHNTWLHDTFLTDVPLLLTHMFQPIFTHTPSCNNIQRCKVWKTLCWFAHLISILFIFLFFAFASLASFDGQRPSTGFLSQVNSLATSFESAADSDATFLWRCVFISHCREQTDSRTTA